METITVSKEDFERIFDRVEREYLYDHLFMNGDELPSEFDNSTRKKHLQRFRSTIKSLKLSLMRA